MLSISFGQIKALSCNWTYFNNLVPQHKITHISFFAAKFVCQVLDRHGFTSSSLAACVLHLKAKSLIEANKILSNGIVFLVCAKNVKFFFKKVKVPQNSCLIGSHLDYCPKAKYISYDGENLGHMNALDMLEAIHIDFH